MISKQSGLIRPYATQAMLTQLTKLLGVNTMTSRNTVKRGIKDRSTSRRKVLARLVALSTVTNPTPEV